MSIFRHAGILSPIPPAQEPSRESNQDGPDAVQDRLRGARGEAKVSPQVEQTRQTPRVVEKGSAVGIPEVQTCRFNDLIANNAVNDYNFTNKVAVTMAF